MTEYLYRVVYRVKEDRWDWKKDPSLNVWQVWVTQTGRRPYITVRPAKSICTRENNKNTRYEFKVQRLPADNWEDL
jgi:hypothetical protein